MMRNLDTPVEMQVLRSKVDGKIATAPAESIGGLMTRVARSLAEAWRHVVFMTTRETAFHLQSAPTRRTRH